MGVVGGAIKVLHIRMNLTHLFPELILVANAVTSNITVCHALCVRCQKRGFVGTLSVFGRATATAWSKFGVQDQLSG